MAITFGATNTDDATFNCGASTMADNGSQLITFWIYPTALTATRNYWGVGTTGRTYCAVAPTTSEIEVGTENVTTDGQWRTTGLGMVTNQWQFVAIFLATENTTVPGQCRVWRGTETTPPVAATVTNNVVRNGNYSGSNIRVVGNESATGALAIEGDMAGYTVVTTLVVGTMNKLKVVTSGTLSAGEESLLYRDWIWPLWYGRELDRELRSGSLVGNVELIYAPLDESGVAYFYNNTNSPASGTFAVTLSGATYTKNAPGRLPDPTWVRRYTERKGSRRLR